ncbi:MAG: L-2-hydroxyglutarate oxidase [Thermoanaerobaculia bacterium]
MSRTPAPDVAVVGGGIIGLATALALAHRGAHVTVLEAEAQPARHQSGRNSGILHAGLYYKPGSLKARLCTAGRRSMEAFLTAHGIPWQRTGKLVVATSQQDVERLDELEQRGRANGLEGLERLDRAGLQEIEPHAGGIAALWVPQTGIADFAAAARTMASELEVRGGRLMAPARVTGIRTEGPALNVQTTAGPVPAARLVNCAGLESDRVARLAGVKPQVRIIPFRGEYCELLEPARGWIRGLVYPVPDPRFPFLGVHFHRRLDGRVEAGPNAVLALKRDGYGRWSFSPRDTAATLSWPGFWRLARGAVRIGAGELLRTMSLEAFAIEAARLLPELTAEHLRRAGCGIRAQAIDREGNLVDDFVFSESEHAVHVLNAPSPGATASLAIGEAIAERVLA